MKLLLPPAAPSPCLLDPSVPLLLSPFSSNSAATCTVLSAAPAAEAGLPPTPLLLPIELLLLEILEEAEAVAGGARREETAGAAPGSFRGIKDADFRGSRLTVVPDVASSTAVAAEFTAAAAAAAALARRAAKSPPPMVARRFSRPARPPAPAADILDDALRGERVRLGFGRAAAAAPAAATPLRPLSKLSSLSPPPPPPSLDFRVRGAALPPPPPREGRGDAALEEGRGERELLEERGDACFCCADSLARREAADTAVSARRDMRLRGGGIWSPGGAPSFFCLGEKAVRLGIPPARDKRGDRALLSCGCGSCSCCCGDDGEATGGTTTAGVGVATPWISTSKRFRAPTGRPIWTVVTAVASREPGAEARWGM